MTAWIPVAANSARRRCGSCPSTAAAPRACPLPSWPPKPCGISSTSRALCSATARRAAAASPLKGCTDNALRLEPGDEVRRIARLHDGDFDGFIAAHPRTVQRELQHGREEDRAEDRAEQQRSHHRAAVTQVLAELLGELRSAQRGSRRIFPGEGNERIFEGAGTGFLHAMPPACHWPPLRHAR